MKIRCLACLGPLVWCAIACGDEDNSQAQGLQMPGPSQVAGTSTAATGGTGAGNIAGTGASEAGTAPMSAGGTGAPIAGTGSAAAGMDEAGAMGAAGTEAVVGTDAGEPPASMECDRDCLLGYMQLYVDALEARDPSQLPVSSELKYEENGAFIELGQGVWESFTEVIEGSRLDFADPVQHNVASQFAYQGSELVRYQVRLKVQAEQIVEIESMLVTASNIGLIPIFSTANIEPQPIFFEPPANPNTREELIEITNLYIDYLEGKKGGTELPFAEDCARYENGQPLAQGRASFELQSWSFVVEPRRVLVVDEEAGITWGMLPFGGVGLAEPLVVGEAFKIMDGEFKMIQAVMRYQKVGLWD